MRGAILPLPQYVFIAWCLVKHRDNFTFERLGRNGEGLAVNGIDNCVRATVETWLYCSTQYSAALGIL